MATIPSPTASNDDAGEMPTHRECCICHQLLQRHLFSKKEYTKAGSSTFTCQQCRRNETAKRCKQTVTLNNTNQGRRSDSGIKRRPNNFGYCNYLDQMFSMKCVSDIVALGIFTSAKDVSESMAAIQAASHHGLINKHDTPSYRVKCLCIGDGSTPRSAALACFTKKWDCISIDPALKDEWQGEEPKSIKGLVGFRGTIEEFVIGADVDHSDHDYLVLLCVHSHARLTGSAAIEKIMAMYNNIPTTLVSMPCCPKFRSHTDMGRGPDISYDDDCVFSACRKVEVWRFHQSPVVCLPAMSD